MLKNNFYRFNRWLDQRETLKLVLMIISVLFGFGSLQFGYLIFGTIMISIICFIAVSRIFIIDGRLKFDRSKYQVPEIGEIVIVKKDFYYDGLFKRYINQSFQGQKPNWWKITKGTELVILNVDKTDGDWKIRFFDQSKGDMYLYYLDTKDYWDTKSNIRNKLLKRLGI